MPKGYSQLTYDQRCQIEALLDSGFTHAAIAKKLGKHPSTISREVKRNQGGRGYRRKQAQAKADERRYEVSSCPRKANPLLLWFIELKLQTEQWSPVQISGWLARSGGLSLSHEWIYLYVWTDKKQGGKLWQHLRRRGKKYNKRAGKTAGRGLIPGRVDIDERPEIVETKSRIGDWEGDTIIGQNHQGALLVHVERASKFVKIALLKNKMAETVKASCNKGLKHLDHLFKTITYDNGKEFSGHADIAKMLGCDIYFAKPYHSWQRGLCEHTNGLIRQYFPKGTDFTKLTVREVQEIEDKLNSRPRKILNFKTPYEVLHQMTTDVALQC